MSLFARLTAPFARPRPWRLLRQVLAVLGRIATALEEQNALMRAANPDAAARMRGPEPAVESGVSYVDPTLVLRAEQTRLDVQRATGKWMTDEELMEYLQATELMRITEGAERS